MDTGTIIGPQTITTVNTEPANNWNVARSGVSPMLADTFGHCCQLGTEGKLPQPNGIVVMLSGEMRKRFKHFYFLLFFPRLQ